MNTNSENRKRVLIITYYWPPSGGAGVQRWLKFTKYLRDFNFEPVIYTAQDPEYPSIDESLYKDVPENLTVLKTRAWEPYTLYKWFTRQKKGHRINTGFLNEEKKKGVAEKISVWIRGNCFIPDARKFWIKPSVQYLTKYLRDHPVDLIVSTGPPHSMHLIALSVSRGTNIPWVADFRDPWTRIDFYHDLMLGRMADRKHHEMEKSVLEKADAVTVVSKDMKRQFEEMGIANIRVIPNGFDPDDFADITGVSEKGGVQNKDDSQKTKNLPKADRTQETNQLSEAEIRLDPKFSLTHIGSIVPSRNPETLWKVLSEISGENENFAMDLEIKLAGASDHSVIKSIEDAKLGDLVTSIEYLPHKEAIHMLKRSQVLLLLINNTPNAKGILTGKFFEYMSSGRPILAIGPTDGEAAEVLKETRCGHIIDFNDHENLKIQILNYYALYREEKLNIIGENIEKYSRKNLTGRLTELFNEVLQSK